MPDLDLDAIRARWSGSAYRTLRTTGEVFIDAKNEIGILIEEIEHGRIVRHRLAEAVRALLPPVE